MYKVYILLVLMYAYKYIYIYAILGALLALSKGCCFHPLFSIFKEWNI